MKENIKPQVMIIDKNAGASFLLMSILKDWGYEITSVNSFLKAVDYCKNSYTPDLIIVEMNEPSVIYYEFPHKFMERTGKTIPMAVHSNETSKEVIIKSIQAGYLDYLVRPVEPEILHDKIKDLIRPDLKLSQKTFNFKMDEDAKITCPMHIDTINEFGIQASVPFQLNSGSLIDLLSPTLSEHGLSSMCVKVVEIKPKTSGDQSRYPYLVKLSFVGLKNSELTKLRKLAIFKGEAA
jgi:CheY-like chemotaxis protein